MGSVAFECSACVAATGKNSGETEMVLRHCQYCGKAAVAGYRCLLCDHEDLVPSGQEAGHGWAKCIGNQRERLGRLVREAWIRFWTGRPDAKPGWLTSYDTLPPEQQAVDDAIGAELYELGQQESAELVLRAMARYHGVLRSVLIDELTNSWPEGTTLRDQIDRALRRLHLIVISGRDPQRMDPEERRAIDPDLQAAMNRLAEEIVAKRRETTDLL